MRRLQLQKQFNVNVIGNQSECDDLLHFCQMHSRPMMYSETSDDLVLTVVVETYTLE